MQYYEDIEIGQRKMSDECFHLSRENIIEFCRQWDPMSYHVDAAAAAGSFVGKLFTSSIHAVAITVRLAHSILNEEPAIVAGLGWDKVKLLKPVCEGDTVRACTYSSKLRDSASQPDKGVLTSAMELYNQYDEMVLSFEITSLILKRPKE